MFPAVPYPQGRLAALLVTCGVLAVVWIPAAWSPQPWRTIPGTLVSAALGIAVLCAARLLLRRLWNWAATQNSDDDDPAALIGTFVMGIAALIGGGYLVGTPFSDPAWAEPFVVPAAVLWAVHELTLCRRVYRQAKQDVSRRVP